jgi:acetylornithine/N-succinyldiaminopimelate aminotransferase
VKHKKQTNIVTFTKSFHGRTLATLTATGQEKIQTGFQPLMPGFSYLPYNDAEALKQLHVIQPSAVMLELVQGEGGVIPANQDWINELISICKEEDILVVIDEVQTGIGRTGKLFAYEHYGFEPDIITLAKGLGSGFPIGAMLAKKAVAASFTPGTHGSTFGGNPLSTTAGCATVEFILEHDILGNCQKTITYLLNLLNELKGEFSFIKEVRGLGLLIGIEINGVANEIVKLALKENLLLLPAGENTVRLLPPLTVTEKDIDLFANRFKQVLTAYAEQC